MEGLGFSIEFGLVAHAFVLVRFSLGCLGGGLGQEGMDYRVLLSTGLAA